LDKPALERVAVRLRCRLFVLRELDGRWEKAAQPFAEIVHAAVWCTGGKRRIAGLRDYLARAGLSLSQLAEITKVSKTLLVRRHLPDVFLELGRTLRLTEESYTGISATRGFTRWGEWWTKPNEISSGKTPLEVFRTNPKEFYYLRNAEVMRIFATSDEDQIQ
jgi:hypothetical protein